MAKIIERKQYSEDGGNWTDKPSGYDAYERAILDFERGWTKEQIRACFTLNSKVEYSTDDSYSWVPFRFSDSADENAARIFTMLQRDYKVRRVVIKQLGKPKVTDSMQSSGSFFRAANVANGNSKQHRVETRTVYVNRQDGGQYTFTDTNPHNGELICTVKQKIIFNMDTPNENEIIYSPAGEVRNKSQMRVRGFVFRFLPADLVHGVEHWWPILRNTNPTIDPKDYVVVKCARVWDDEMDPFFDGLGPVMVVISNKYILSWRTRNKFGDTWLMSKQFQKMAEDRIRAKGGMIETPSTSNLQLEKDKSHPYTAEVSPEYIMGIKENFQKIVEVGSDQQIMDSLIKVVDFRNRCVDELKELNKVIEEARNKVRENANG